MIKYELKKSVLSFEFLFYILSICVLVFIFAYISEGFPEIYTFESYIKFQWENILIYLFPIMPALFINDVICHEYQSGKTTNILLYIHSKQKLLFYKLFVIIIASILMMIALLIFSIITFMVWQSRVVQFANLLTAVKIIIKIIVYLIPLELVFIYISYRSTNALSIILIVYFVFNVIDVFVPQLPFTPTSLLGENYSYKNLLLIVYLLIGLCINIKYISGKDYSL